MLTFEEFELILELLEKELNNLSQVLYLEKGFNPRSSRIRGYEQSIDRLTRLLNKIRIDQNFEIHLRQLEDQKPTLGTASCVHQFEFKSLGKKAIGPKVMKCKLCGFIPKK